jgi:hypothetical protein
MRESLHNFFALGTCMPSRGPLSVPSDRNRTVTKNLVKTLKNAKTNL